MSMSTHVVGFRPPDKEWKKMKAAWDTCTAANVAPPGEVERFFGYQKPNAYGIEIKLDVEELTEEGVVGFDVILSKVPKSVDRIRFYNSW